MDAAENCNSLEELSEKKTKVAAQREQLDKMIVLLKVKRDELLCI